MTPIYIYSPFTYFGSSNFFRFFLPSEILYRNCFVRIMWHTSTFWKCIWFENMGSITKVMSMNVKNVTCRFCPFFPLEWSNEMSDESLPISTLFHSIIVSCSASAFYVLSHSVSKCSHAFCHAQEWQANDVSRATLRLAWPNGAKNNGAKMTSRSRQKFPERMSGAKRIKITLPSFSFLTASDLTQTEDFEQLFHFQGPVISECTYSFSRIRSLADDLHNYYRKRGSASYCARVTFVRGERERERRLWRHWYHAEIASDHAYDYLDGAQTQRVDAFWVLELRSACQCKDKELGAWALDWAAGSSDWWMKMGKWKLCVRWSDCRGSPSSISLACFNFKQEE